MMLMSVTDVMVSHVGIAIVLSTDDDPRCVPIFVGPAEAQSITMALNNIDPGRPLTHDLFCNVMKELVAELQRINITRIVDGTFYAELIVNHEGIVKRIDSRPSDAIALSLRCSAPIYIDEAVFESVAKEIPEAAKGKDKDKSASRTQEEVVDPIEALKRRMAHAVQEERYEDAAKIRDRITVLTEHKKKGDSNSQSARH